MLCIIGAFDELAKDCDYGGAAVAANWLGCLQACGFRTVTCKVWLQAPIGVRARRERLQAREVRCMSRCSK